VATKPYSLESNAVRVIDLWVLGPKRMYSVDGVAFDPEGLLSTIPAIVSVLIGFETTRFLVSQSNRSRGLLVLAGVGLAGIAAGWAWGFVWPVNKALWTGSYVVLTSGWAMLVLSSLVWLMDLRGYEFRPLQAFGLNPLFLYIFAWVWMLSYWLIPVGNEKLFPVIFGFFLAGEPPSKASSFLFAISHVAFFWVFAELLYRKRIVIKV
jgi:predicted acyltransferase